MRNAQDQTAFGCDAVVLMVVRSQASALTEGPLVPRCISPSGAPGVLAPRVYLVHIGAFDRTPSASGAKRRPLVGNDRWLLVTSCLKCNI